MKIGVVSDSHGDIKTLSKILDFFEQSKVSLTVHLGDSINDTGIFNIYKVPFIAVPGTRDPGYSDPQIRTQFKKIKDKLISISHIKENNSQDSDIILYGHTHRPDFYLKNGKLYINPGHVINDKKRHPISSFVILEVNSKVTVSLYSTENQLIEKKDFLL